MTLRGRERKREAKRKRERNRERERKRRAERRSERARYGHAERDDGQVTVGVMRSRDRFENDCKLQIFVCRAAVAFTPPWRFATLFAPRYTVSGDQRPLSGERSLPEDIIRNDVMSRLAPVYLHNHAIDPSISRGWFARARAHIFHALSIQTSLVG